MRKVLFSLKIRFVAGADGRIINPMLLTRKPVGGVVAGQIGMSSVWQKPTCSVQKRILGWTSRIWPYKI